MRIRRYLIGEEDHAALQACLSESLNPFGRDAENLKSLHRKVARAKILAEGSLPKDVVTLYSRVRFRDLRSREEESFVVVLPGDANLAARRISVLSPMGTALLGARVGDSVGIRVPGGFRAVRILRVRQLRVLAGHLAA